MNVPRGDGDIKTFGGLITYLRRYVITGMLNVAADADLEESEEPDAGAGRSPVAAEIHPEMRDAASIGALSKVMSGLSKEEKAKYADYYNQRTQELREAA
jgi:hypothetical protein